MSAGREPGGRTETGRDDVTFAPAPAAPPRALPATQPIGATRPVPISLSRRTHLVVSRVDAWSVLKVAFAWSLVLLVVGLVAVVAVYTALTTMGVFQSVNDVLADVTGGARFVLPGLGPVFTVALVLGLVDVVLLTALSTVGALIYNTIAALTGGVEVTVADAE